MSHDSDSSDPTLTTSGQRKNDPEIQNDQQISFESSNVSGAPARPVDPTAPTEATTGPTRSRTKPAGLKPGEVIASRYEIRESLGRGGFGAVYRAHDRELNRLVALKKSNGLRSFVSGQIRNEAQSVASLNHPCIVAIHDLVTVDRNELFIVMECLEGATLRKRLLRGQFTIGEAVRIGVDVAGALQHAHERMLVHSDLKPANLFVCDDGRIKLLDFGLAVAYFPDQPPSHVGGTPGYMSPEQIRGESHRIDGRADIFAFGVVLYELLTGSKPFVGGDSRAVCDATLRKEVPPPRQLNAAVDEELQRIVLKCLEKRSMDRYHSAAALRDDLQHWLTVHGGTAASSSIDTDAAKTNQSAIHSSSIRLHSRGLLPYTEQHADSYLTLVPGPRDRNGIPDSIVFWKRWVQSDDPATDYPVGVLYGPSGSGKSSYVSAGLLPQLDRDICKVYIACRPGDLGGRLTRVIQSRIHEESADSSLRDLLTRLRSDDSSSRGFRKLLIVLDQFESWSLSATVEERHDLADALRQCDGTQIRALVVVRDDYWMGIKELLGWLELPLQEGRNVASVDLLDRQAAMRILEAMGRETGTLPASGVLSSGQQQYIRQAVDELAVGDAIICVHLVMFAQMVRLQKWTPRGLRRSGGVAGACSLFFQELFQKSGSQSPEYRRLADAVPLILLELLPGPNDTVTSVAVTRSQLAEVTAAAGQQHLLDDCLRILTEDLRIVTIVAEELAAEEVPEEPQYRLAHDFLVQPINVWLDRVRSRTWRGRSKAHLGRLAEAWTRRPIPAHLPGFIEFLTLLASSAFQRKSDSESRYLRAATRLHAGRISISVIALMAFVLMSVMAWRQWMVAGEERYGRMAAKIDLLLNAPAEDLYKHITDLQQFGRNAEVQVAPWTESPNLQTSLRAHIYLQSIQPESIAGITSRLEQASPALFETILAIARDSQDASTELNAVLDEDSEPVRSARAALLLAYLGDTNALAERLSDTDQTDRHQTQLLEATDWRIDLDPSPFVQLLNDHPDSQVRYHAAVILGSFPRQTLIEAGAEIGIDELVNSPNAELHSVGMFLAKHLGQPIPAARPPAGANWRLGPNSVPMVRLEPDRVEIELIRNDGGKSQVVEIDRPIWFSTIPVSMQQFNEFVQAVPRLPNETDNELASLERFNLPEPIKSDPQTPVLYLNQPQAFTYCNWLSEREGLQPCYRYTGESAVPVAGDFKPPPTPWEEIEGANGYRLPTSDQYRYALYARYVSGTPWDHAPAVGRAGGDYSSPNSNEYFRGLHTLIPNRLGLFLNDVQCGSWVFGADPMEKAMRPAGIGIEEYSVTRDRRLTRFSIYLVQHD